MMPKLHFHIPCVLLGYLSGAISLLRETNAHKMASFCSFSNLEYIQQGRHVLMAEILALRRLRNDYCVFGASLGYGVRPCLKTTIIEVNK